MNTLPEHVKDYIELAKTEFNYHELDGKERYETIIQIMLSAMYLYDRNGIKIKQH